MSERVSEEALTWEPLVCWRGADLRQERSRLALRIAVVSLSAMLIALMNGSVAGFDRQVSVNLDSQPASMVVARGGVENFSVATSRLSAEAVERTRSTAGVGRVVAIDAQSAIPDLHGRRQFATLLGYDPAEGGGPRRSLQGPKAAGSDEVIVAIGVLSALLPVRQTAGLDPVAVFRRRVA